MAKKLVQRLRKIVNFHVEVPRELRRQLGELENGFYGALDTLVGNLGDYLGISGLDGVKVVPGGGGVLVARRSRETIVVTAGGTIAGSARKDVVRFESLSAHVTVYGFVEPGADDTHRLLLINASSYTVTFAHNTTATAAQRVLCPHSVDYELRPGECIEVEYQEVATERRWRVLGDSKPFHVVRSLEDLPTPAAGVITLNDRGLWFFANFVDGSTSYRLVVEWLTNVWMSDPDSGFRATTTLASGLAAVTVKNHLNPYPFQAHNDGTGYGLHIDPDNTLRATFNNWISLCQGGVKISNNYTQILGGLFGPIVLPGVGGEYELESIFTNYVEVGSGTTIAEIHCRNVRQGPGRTEPLVTVPNGVTISRRVQLDRCVAYRLVSLGTGINGGGTAYPHVTVRDSSGGSGIDITLGAVPAGGLHVEGNKLYTTPYSGFTELTTNVTCLNNYTVFGTKLRDTPNGHIARNLAGADLTQRHYLRASTGIQLADNGTETTIACTISDVGIGAADTVLQTNAGATATEWQKIFNANVDTNALIAVDKLAKSAAQHSVLVSNAAANSFSTDPEVDTILIYEAANFREGGDPGDPSEGAWVHYHGTDTALVARFQNTYRHDLAPDNPTEGGVDSMAKHFHEKYTFSRSAGSGAYAFLTEGYSSPFGMTHGTSQVLNVRGWVALDVLVAGTPGGTETWRFWGHFNTDGTLHTLFFWQEEYNGTGSGTPTTNPSGTGLTIAEVSEQIQFGISNPAVDVRLMVEIVGHCWTAEAP